MEVGQVFALIESLLRSLGVWGYIQAAIVISLVIGMIGLVLGLFVRR